MNKMKSSPEFGYHLELPKTPVASLSSPSPSLSISNACTTTDLGNSTRNHRTSAKKSTSSSHQRIREKTIEKMLSSSHSKRQQFIQKFRSNEDVETRFSLIKELMGEYIRSSEGVSLEIQERNSILEFLSSFSLEEGIEYEEFYAELEETIHHEIDQYEESLFWQAEGDIEEMVENFDPSLDEGENLIICPICWVNTLNYDSENELMYCTCGKENGTNTSISLRSSKYQAVLSPQILKQILSDTFDRHLAICRSVREGGSQMLVDTAPQFSSPGCGLVCTFIDAGSLLGCCEMCGFYEVII